MALAEPESQIDPKYTRITAKALRAALIRDKGWKEEGLPCEKTIGNILNRLNYGVDHDLGVKPKLVPFGILEVVTGGLLTIIFGVSFETRDFLVAALEHWWQRNRDKHCTIKQLVINLDNGPNNSSQRT